MKLTDNFVLHTNLLHRVLKKVCQAANLFVLIHVNLQQLLDFVAKGFFEGNHGLGFIILIKVDHLLILKRATRFPAVIGLVISLPFDVISSYTIFWSTSIEDLLRLKNAALTWLMIRIHVSKFSHVMGIEIMFFKRFCQFIFFLTHKMTFIAIVYRIFQLVIHVLIMNGTVSVLVLGQFFFRLLNDV